MDRNTLLALALSLLIMMAWTMWQASLQPPPVPPATAPPGQAPGTSEPARPPVVPTPPGFSIAAESPSPPGTPAIPAPRAVASEQVAAWSGVLETELYRAEVTNRGAALVSWKLLDPTFTEKTPTGEVPIQLLSMGGSEGHVLQTPFTDLGLGDLSTHHYKVEQVSGEAVSFSLQLGGVTIRKVYRVEPENYLMRLSVSLRNDTGRVLNPRFATQWPAEVRKGKDFEEQSLVALHGGEIEREVVAGIGVPGFFSDLFGNADPDGVVRMPGGVEWAGVDMKYFVGVLMPDRTTSANARFEPLKPGHSAMAVVDFDAMALPSGQGIQNEYRVYVGPKLPERLEAVGSQLPLAVDLGYGWVAPLTSFFAWLLKLIYSVVHNYGVAIIVLTILVRVATLPIVSRQMKSMERMRALQPEVTALQEKHKDDKQQLSQETMKLYRERGVNPLGGCLPMLLQFPVFIGLFFALRSSIELRNAPFFGYITDLSAPATLFVVPGLDLPVRLLPILMGLSMVVQQRMTPMTIDPAQARMMMTIMPVMMTVLFYQFPSGLVLYWMVSNVLGIAHQAWVGRQQRAAA